MIPGKPVRMRECKRCHVKQPIDDEHFRPQGRGFMHICTACEAKRVPVRNTTEFDERVTATGLAIETRDLLKELVSLLRSPVCSRCGGYGAKLGNPSQHEECGR